MNQHTLLQRYLVAAGAAFITFFALPETAPGQAIKLLKDLKPGIVENDKRKIIQLETSADVVYVLSERPDPYSSYDSMYYVNTVDGTGSESDVGFALGRISDFGEAAYTAGYPIFAVRNGKAVFPSEQWKYCYAEYDGKTNSLRKLTSDGTTNPPLATWLGVDGRVCFFRRTTPWNSYEVGYLDTTTSTGLNVSRLLPFHRDNSSAYTIPYTGVAKVLNEKLIFTIYEEDSRKVTIWASDGTFTGTEQLLSQTAGDHLSVKVLTGLGKGFFSVAENNGATSLYVTDGTTSGTSLINSQLQAPLPNAFSYQHAESSTTLYWVAPAYDRRIHYSDGVNTGVLPYDAMPFHDASAVLWLNDKLYVTTTNNYGIANQGPLYVSDGFSTPTEVQNPDVPFSGIYAKAESTLGTYLYTGRPNEEPNIYFTENEIEDATLAAHGTGSFLYPPHIAAHGDRAIFTQLDNLTNSDQLWITNPVNPYEPQCLTRFSDIPQSSYPGDYEVSSDAVYFQNLKSSSTWWAETFKTNGTAEGSMPVTVNNPVWLGEAANSMLFYQDNRDVADGTVYFNPVVHFFDGLSYDYQDYVQATYGEPPSVPSRLFSLGPECFFGGGDGQLPILYSSDGTLQGTKTITNFFDSNLEPPLYPVGIVGSRGIFYARVTTTTVINYEIWSTDGTGAGTFKIGESIMPPTKGAVVSSGKIVFGVLPKTSIPALVVSDGTAEGTDLFTDVYGRRFPVESPWSVISSAGRGYFIVQSPREHVWATDGTASGTYRVNLPFHQDPIVDLKPSQHGGFYYQNAWYGRSRTGYINGNVDGIPRVLKETFSGPFPQLLEEVNGFMYTAITTPELGRELYRTRGISGEFELVEDFAPGAASGAVMDDAAVIGNRLIFAADPRDGVTGVEPHYIEVLDSNVDDWQLY